MRRFAPEHDRNTDQYKYGRNQCHGGSDSSHGVTTLRFRGGNISTEAQYAANDQRPQRQAPLFDGRPGTGIDAGRVPSAQAGCMNDVGQHGKWQELQAAKADANDQRRRQRDRLFPIQRCQPEEREPYRNDEAPPEGGSLVYVVDFSANTGETTRWSTQFGVAPAYADRRDADEKLVVFDSAPLESAMELAGDPVLTLFVSSATNDPVFHAYLEVVLPDGTVSYVTEGIFRAIHRAPADPATLPYEMGLAPHSFRKEDMLPVTPGELMKVEFALNPVAARLNPGERVRLAIAGTDTACFRRYSQGKPEAFTISFGPETPSALTLPLRPWSDVGTE
jgi:hypothetical protein